MFDIRCIYVHVNNVTYVSNEVAVLIDNDSGIVSTEKYGDRRLSCLGNCIKESLRIYVLNTVCNFTIMCFTVTGIN